MYKNFHLSLELIKLNCIPGHLISIKYELGRGTSRFNLWLRKSSTADG